MTSSNTATVLLDFGGCLIIIADLQMELLEPGQEGSQNPVDPSNMKRLAPYWLLHGPAPTLRLRKHDCNSISVDVCAFIYKNNLSVIRNGCVAVPVVDEDRPVAVEVKLKHLSVAVVPPPRAQLPVPAA